MGRWEFEELTHRPFYLFRNNQKGAVNLARETIEVPITGKIISVNVKIGDQVKDDDVLCVLESMKMENPIVSTVGGTVVEVGVKVDQVVKPGDTVAVIEY
ncbi:MAG: acetyl-CoA carboxylase biotin carboxyl carrier protein subunit [Dehalococcoidales bacterium]